jgi:hypothetical protein
MLRFLIQYILPLFLPLLLYLGFLRLASGTAPGWINRTPWIPLLGAGVVLLGISLIAWGALEGADPASTYVPPRLEDGRIVPGTFVPPPPADTAAPER